jgi:hypothetical protein
VRHREANFVSGLPGEEFAVDILIKRKITMDCPD